MRRQVGLHQGRADPVAEPQKRHGYLAANGPLAGDLPNQFAGADGRLKASLVTNAFSLGNGKKSIFDRDGVAIILNKRGDDYRTQPLGNAGDRIACGVVTRTVHPAVWKRSAARPLPPAKSRLHAGFAALTRPPGHWVATQHPHDIIRAAMGLEKPTTLAARDLIDAEALRHALTALARETGDPGTLRKSGLALIKQAFNEGRDKVRHAVEKEGLSGIAAARALSALQDAIIQVIYDFAVKHVYYAQNPSTAERIAIVATGGYGRGELAPGSDIDLLFVRPFKQTAWGESVIEFILYMLWDLGLKVGHATRSLAECVRLAKLDVTIRTAVLEARYLWGDRGPV